MKPFMSALLLVLTLKAASAHDELSHGEEFRASPHFNLGVEAQIIIANGEVLGSWEMDFQPGSVGYKLLVRAEDKRLWSCVVKFKLHADESTHFECLGGDTIGHLGSED